MKKLMVVFENWESGRLEKSDDTLLNRLCISVLCHNSYHERVCDVIDERWEHILVEFYKSLPGVCSTFNTYCTKLLKLAVSLSFRFHKRFRNTLIPEVLRLLTHYISTDDTQMTTSILEAMNHYVESCELLTDVEILHSMLDAKTLQLLHRRLLHLTNVHRRKILLKLFAHLALYDAQSHGYSSDNKVLQHFTACLAELSDAGLSLVFTINDIAEKFSLCISAIDLGIPFPLHEDNLSICSLDTLARSLYLLCIGAIHFVNFDENDAIRLLQLDNRAVAVCARVIALSFRSVVHTSGLLWCHLLFTWSSAVLNNLMISRHAQLSQLITPIVCASAGAVQTNSVNVDGCFLNHVISELFSPPNQDDTSPARAYRISLLRLCNVLINRHLKSTDLKEWLGKLSKRLFILAEEPLDDFALTELTSLMRLSKQICRVLVLQEIWEPVFTLLDQYIALMSYSNNQVLFCSVSHTIIELIRQINSTQHTHVTKVIFQSISLLGYAPCFSKDPGATAWDRGHLFLSYIRFLVDDGGLLMQAAKHTAVDFFADTMSYQGVLLTSGEARGLYMCLVLSFMCLYFSDSSFCSAELTDKRLSDRLLHICTQLLDFDLTELMESHCTLRILRGLAHRLSQLYKMKPDPEMNSVATMVLNKIAIGLGNDFCSESQFCVSSVCPTCGESVAQLLDDLLIAHPGAMIVDCSEG